MKRNITKKLIEWKEDKQHKPLIVRGARQIGKSYSIMDFGKRNFEGNIHLLNFEKNPELHTIFERNLDAKRILTELELSLNKRIIPEKDLLFFDEIQECPKAILSLRYFYEEISDLHVISAGSLLEFALQDISFPVGRVQMLSMYPMTFSEFLIANNKSIIAEKIKETKIKLSTNIIELINVELYKYFIVGGMPECVQTYVNTQSFIKIASIQSDLITTFRQDFSKYVGHSDKRCLNSVLSSAALKTGEQIKYSHLSSDFSSPTIKKAYELLETARLFTKVKAASPSGVPLGASASEKKFKSIFLDIGLLSSINGFYNSKILLKDKILSSFNGKMAEQFIGQELRALNNGNLYYWSRESRGSSAEVDYLVEKEGEVIPIEVKSGKSGSLKSLHLLLKTFSNVKKAYVFTEDKYGELPEQKLSFFPLFNVSYTF